MTPKTDLADRQTLMENAAAELNEIKQKMKTKKKRAEEPNPPQPPAEKPSGDKVD